MLSLQKGSGVLRGQSLGLRVRDSSTVPNPCHPPPHGWRRAGQVDVTGLGRRGQRGESRDQKSRGSAAGRRLTGALGGAPSGAEGFWLSVFKDREA